MPMSIFKKFPLRCNGLSQGQKDLVATLAPTVKAVVDTPQVAETIQKGVITLMDAVPPLMKGLDEVAKIHPFIGGTSPFLSSI